MRAGNGGEVFTGFAAQALEQVAGIHEPIGLAEVDGTAALQTRQDQAYLVAPEVLADMDAELRTRFRALEINGKRLMSYESVYFDTPDHGLFRDHRQGRRQRYKIRTRRYVDTETRFTEIKLKSGRGETVKFRTPRTAEPDMSELTTGDFEFLASVVGEHYGAEVPQLTPSLTSLYRRTTFVDPVHGERLTCDVDVAWSYDGRQQKCPDLVLLETKASGRGYVDSLLLDRGIRPLSMSKYAIGIALLNPHLPANRWSRLLRTVFGAETGTAQPHLAPAA